MVGIGGLGQPNINPLRINLQDIVHLQTKLSTGKSINRASDAPAGLVISERLRADYEAFQQGIENSQRASNVVNHAESSLGEVARLLGKAKELTVAAGDGSLSSAERDALQFELDGILGSIDRIGNTADFAGIRPLDGSLEPRIENQSPGISNIRVDSVSNAGDLPRTVNVTVTNGATRANAAGTITGQTATTQVLIRGRNGSAVVDLAAGSTVSDIEDAFNSVSDQTGVEAVAGQLRSTDFGSSSFVEIQELSGDLEGITAGNFTGTDIQGTIDGRTASGSGTTLSVDGGPIGAAVTFEDTAAPGDFTFDVTSAGFTSELGTGAANIGIQRASTDSLGGTSGIATLTSLYTGGANSLLSNPENASAILDSAISEVSGQRARLGAFSSQILESNENILSAGAIELARARSQISDTDYASTLAELSARRIQQQAQISVLAQSQNINRTSLLTLLGS